jgi:hypothetical protein
VPPVRNVGDNNADWPDITDLLTPAGAQHAAYVYTPLAQLIAVNQVHVYAVVIEHTLLRNFAGRGNYAGRS